MVDYQKEYYQEDVNCLRSCLKPLFKSNQNNSFLLTGATGLVGSLLVDAIAGTEEIQIGKASLTIVTRKKENAEQRFPYILNSNVSVIEHDIRDGFPDDQPFDYIIHLASNADPSAYRNYPVETIETNVVSAVGLVRHLRKNPQTKAVITSSIEVYGETDTDILKETDYGKINFNILRAGYPESKRISELIIKSGYEEYGIQCMIARLAYLYGPTMKNSDDKIVSDLIRKAKCGGEFVMNTPGIQKRSYCYVRDAASALLTLLDRGEAGEVYNVANQNSEITIRGLVELVCEMYDMNCKISEKDVPRTNTNLVLNTDKLEALGWHPEVLLRNGIQRSVDVWTEE